jgi:chromosomal replication initiation ATPase DnaA
LFKDDFGRRKETSIKFLKWYFLREYAGLTYEFIKILFKEKRHTTISQTINRIKNNKARLNKFDKFIKIIIGEK